MKRTISMILAVLMLLPLIASMAIAVSPSENEQKNIADSAEISMVNGLPWGDWEPDCLIDGDKEYGTASPKGRESSFKLTFSEEFYISNVVITVNGKGETASESFDEVVYDTASVKVKGYDNKGRVVYESEAMDTKELVEATFPVNNDVIEIEIIINPLNATSQDAYCYLWEVEAYNEVPPVRCDAEQENIISDALLSSTVYDKKEGKNKPSSWWAMDLSRIVDGDIHTGSHTVKSSAFSIWLNYGKERLLSEIVIHCNGNGALSPATGKHTKDIKDATDQPLGEGVDYFNSYEIKVVLYDYNDEVVYESDLVDVSIMTEFVAQAGVKAATVEIQISNGGGAGQGGDIFLWDLEVYEEKGEHVYELYNQENPLCGIPGYKQYQCQDPSCEMRKVETIPATGYHTWDEGVVSNDPTETANGTKILTCVDCGQKIERDVKALNHNWDGGTVIKPHCDDGYTLYKCTDAGCTLTYKDNFVKGIGHKYDEGKVEKVATVDEAGELVFTCLREGCGYKLTKEIRPAKYIDNTTKIDNSIVTVYNASHNSELAKYIFDGNKTDGNYWCAPGTRAVEKDAEGKPLKDENGKDIEIRNSGTLELILDKDYYFTKGKMYVYSNYNWMEVHFMYQDEEGKWQTSATFTHDRIDTQGAISVVDMTGSLNQGARASKIVIESVSAKTIWNIPVDGSGLQFHEIELEAHECDIQPENYEAKENWKMPTCSEPGSCKATCPVCKLVSTVTLDSETYAHDYSDVVVKVDPTCSKVGKGEKKCSMCNLVVSVDVPATGEHNYKADKVFMPADCSTKGVGHKVCDKCGDISYQYPIEPTGAHNFKYITHSHANYTAIGKDIFACEYCLLQGDKEDIITNKLEIPDNFITFKGYSIRMTGYVGIRASFQFDQEILDEIEKTCDVTITIYAKNVKTGKVVSAEVYGKNLYYSNTEKFNENNEFSAVAKVTNCDSEYEFSYEVKLRNFRGTEIKTVVVPGYTNGKTTTTVREIAKDAINAPTINSDVEKFLEEILAE